MSVYDFQVPAVCYQHQICEDPRKVISLYHDGYARVQSIGETSHRTVGELRFDRGFVISMIEIFTEMIGEAPRAFNPEPEHKGKSEEHVLTVTSIRGDKKNCEWRYPKDYIGIPPIFEEIVDKIGALEELVLKAKR